MKNDADEYPLTLAVFPASLGAPRHCLYDWGIVIDWSNQKGTMAV